MSNDQDITFFGETNFRGVKRRFGIKRGDRQRHMYVIGKTGMGKTTLLDNMTIQDIQRGEGVGVVDPHGEYAERMLDFIPPSRINDVVYFNPSDTDFPVAFNVMEDVGPERRHLVSSGLLGVFKKIWPDVWSARMEYLLSNSILALLETPGTTLLGINRILADKEFRKQIVSNVKDPIVKAFWENEYARYTEKFASEAGAAVQNKIGQFTSNPLIRNIIGQSKSTIDMRKIMDEKKIFIMNLSKGRIGEENAKLLGAMLITRLYLAAMTRIDIPEEKRSDFYLYVDEFQNFATESFASILSEARKYHLDLILAHQYIEQMSEEVRDAVFGNVGSMLTFRVGALDAELLEKEFMPEFVQQDLVNLGFASIYLRLMIDGVASRPFSASTLPPTTLQDRSYREEIIANSRKLYGHDRKNIDRDIMEWQGFLPARDGVIITRPREVREAPRYSEPRQNFRDILIPQKSQPLQMPMRTAPTPGALRQIQPSAKPPEQERPAQEQKYPSREFTHGDSARIQPPKTLRISGVLGKAPLQAQAPQRPIYDIRHDIRSDTRLGIWPREPKKEPRSLATPQPEKPKPFMSLSQLQGKPEAKTSFVPLAGKRPELPKKKLDFAELKKALSESFVLQNSSQHQSGPIMHDRTGMIKPRDPNTPIPERPKESQELPRPGAFVAGRNAPPPKSSQGGVLKPGDRIKF